MNGLVCACCGTRLSLNVKHIFAVNEKFVAFFVGRADVKYHKIHYSVVVVVEKDVPCENTEESR